MKIDIPPDSMPEPDVSVARGEDDDYLDLAPGPADVALVVEGSDSCVEQDRGDDQARHLLFNFSAESAE